MRTAGTGSREVRPIRILLSEGASTSARQAITALALKGHEVEICDPDPFCLGRFSCFVRRFHRCPAMGADPKGYLSFVLDLVSKGSYDILIPIHEQGFLFAKAYDALAPHVAVALPVFTAYEQAYSKAAFSRLLLELDLPQPATRIAASCEEALQEPRFPMVIKTAIGTASRGAWVISDFDALRRRLDEIISVVSDAQPLLVQDFVPGPVEQAQAVFSHGRLIACHAYRHLLRGAGGGAALKESVRRPQIRAHLERIGGHLRWHGALSVDYIMSDENDAPFYIDCNPRLVEPMSAVLAGLDLVDLLVRISKGCAIDAVSESRVGVQTHSSIQALLGCAATTNSRWQVLRECWRLLAMKPPYSGSKEELTPVATDPASGIPLAIAALCLLAYPSAARTLPNRRWGAHLLTPEGVRDIQLGPSGWPASSA